ncbi:hypothetical protein D3C71_349140 [compost metagenome]
MFYTSDSQGEIKLWDASTFQLTDQIKLFNGSIYLSQKIDDHSIIVCGNDLRNASYQIKILDLSKNNAIRVIADSIPSNITSVTPGYEEGSFFFGTESGDIFKLELPSMNFSKFKTVTSKIVGLQCWAASKKLFYATPTGVFDLMTDRSYYTSPPDAYITYLGFCQSIAQFYIGIGEDMLLYDILTGCDHKLYPVHDSMITSCTCSESTGTFLTTSLDGYGALWTKNGNINEVLKGNKAELYGGYLDPDEKFAVTVGRREMSTNRAADTSTIKYWFLSGFFEEKKEAHLFGATSVIYANNLDYVITGGNNGQVKIWDEHLNLIESRDINHSGISALFWDENKNKIWFGTFDGNTGYIELSENGKVVSINSIQTHTEKVNSIVIDTKGKVYSVGKDGVLFIQDNQNNRMDSVYFDWEIAELQFSTDYKSILFAASDKVVLFDLTTRKKTIFQHDVKVNSVKWINRTQFASVSGQFLRIWNTNNQGTLILKADNNLRNVMTSLYVDTKQGLIYTGMWSGFIFCWDFYGRQLFELDQLTSLADNSIIHGICGSKDNSCFYSVDYNGNLAKWYSPYSFINKQLSIKSDCSE